MFNFIKNFIRLGRESSGVVENTLKSGNKNSPLLLIISSEKKNQNYYRDLELARQTRALFLSEKFPWEDRMFDVASVVSEYFDDELPDWIFLNYNHGYTWQLKNLDSLGVPIVGFVGDHYDFTDDAPRAVVKQNYFRNLSNLVAMVTAYPHTSSSVSLAIERSKIPFLYLPWAVDSNVFCDLGKHRKYDIACLGALTEGKYPLRRMVREWIEKESGLRYIRKKRIGGHDGEQFNRALNMTYSAFTCASVFRYTLMKYFEIPASGALLFGEATPELEALGFADGEHFVAVNENNYADRIAYYTSRVGRPEGERIRRKGLRFVAEHHTWSIRVPKFINEVQKILEQRVI